MSAVRFFQNELGLIRPLDSFDNAAEYLIPFPSPLFDKPAFDGFDDQQCILGPYQYSQASDSTTNGSDSSLESSPCIDPRELQQLGESPLPRDQNAWLAFCQREAVAERVAEYQRTRRRSSIIQPSHVHPAYIMLAQGHSRIPRALVSPDNSECDSDNGDDDDYKPVHESSSRRRRGGVATTSSPARKAKASTPYPSPTTTSQRARGSPPSRNTQASGNTTALLVRKVNATSSEVGPWICPECGWNQENKRMPDFKRHLRTHLRSNNEDHDSGHWCHGVPLEKARLYDISADAEAYSFRGQLMIGGCMKSFSRRDALKRHLDNANMTCVTHEL